MLGPKTANNRGSRITEARIIEAVLYTNLQVRSVDSWERVRLEGYGYITLPQTPGTHTYTVDTWRPEGPNNTTKLRRFFIGGTPELSDVRYVHVPSNYAAHPVSFAPSQSYYHMFTCAPSQSFHCMFMLLIYE